MPLNRLYFITGNEGTRVLIETTQGDQTEGEQIQGKVDARQQLIFESPRREFADLAKQSNLPQPKDVLLRQFMDYLSFPPDITERAIQAVTGKN